MNGNVQVEVHTSELGKFGRWKSSLVGHGILPIWVDNSASIVVLQWALVLKVQYSYVGFQPRDWLFALLFMGKVL